MLCISRVGIIEALLPGLIALTSILVVVIAFLLERYIPVRGTPGRYESYRNLIIAMSVALAISGIASLLSLCYLLGMLWENMYWFILASFVIDILIIVAGTIITVVAVIFFKK
ncbi:MAG: hypothetical protein QMD80_00110 [archaeon]|nr:hypothetical protein [archaeon]